MQKTAIRRTLFTLVSSAALLVTAVTPNAVATPATTAVAAPQKAAPATLPLTDAVLTQAASPATGFGVVTGAYATAGSRKYTVLYDATMRATIPYGTITARPKRGTTLVGVPYSNGWIKVTSPYSGWIPAYATVWWGSSVIRNNGASRAVYEAWFAGQKAKLDPYGKAYWYLDWNQTHSSYYNKGNTYPQSYNKGVKSIVWISPYWNFYTLAFTMAHENTHVRQVYDVGYSRFEELVGPANYANNNWELIADCGAQYQGYPRPYPNPGCSAQVAGKPYNWVLTMTAALFNGQLR